MDDPITTFDTFTVDAYTAEPETPTRVIARLPQIGDAGAKENAKRYDTRETKLGGGHYPTSQNPTNQAIDTDTVDASLAVVLPVEDPTVTLRVDTIAPQVWHETDIVGAVQHAPRPQAKVNDAYASAGLDEEWSTSWLLQAEAIILPYSRWIVLAAVCAALGLSLVLLRGSRAPQLEAPSNGPNASYGIGDEALVIDSTPIQPGASQAADWAAESSVAEASLRPLGGEAIAGELSPSATGPVSAPVIAAFPRAELVGRVEHPASGSLGPASEETASVKIEVASRPTAYPSTAASGFGGASGSFK